MSERAEPVGGRLLPTGGRWMLGLVALAAVILGWRFAVGLGPTTAMSDGYPWGLWIAFDVVTGTALACGGYAVAILVYILNRGKYHPLVRSALVTSALGYTMGGLAVVIDLGRWWNVPKLPFFLWEWNLDSILLEVAVCIMLYTLVLWIELSPAFLERWQEEAGGRLKSFARKATPAVKKALPWLIALGLLLPTMHQSSLGTLMFLAGPRLHPLWATPLLPLLFLVSCIGMGYGVVIVESIMAGRAFDRPIERPQLAGLTRPVMLTMILFVAVRFVDMGLRGRLGMAFALDGYSLLFLLENALFLVPAVYLLGRRRQRQPGSLVRGAGVLLLAGALYRFSTFLIAFQPGESWTYFPALPEVLVTLGLVSFEVLAYTLIVKRFPILQGAPAPARS